MGKLILIIISLLTIQIKCLAQVNISGYIIDDNTSKGVLSSIILKDDKGKILAYTNSKSDGFYEFYTTLNGIFSIQASSLSYEIQNKKIQNVIISGFINQSEIGNIYNMADVFVMCSGIGETWGLSVNEAMNFGLPIIVSGTCGSAYDLVENGQNGFIFKEGDIGEMKMHLENLCKDEALRVEFGKKSSEKIMEHSHHVTVQNILEAMA